jgi:hypothetical protein
MATQEVVTTAELARQIQACSEEKFTGQLDLEIKDPKGQRWSLYFHLGGLIWATSEVHPMRRLHRQLSQHCLQLVIDSEALASLRDRLCRSRVGSASVLGLPLLSRTGETGESRAVADVGGH